MSKPRNQAERNFVRYVLKLLPDMRGRFEKEVIEDLYKNPKNKKENNQ